MSALSPRGGERTRPWVLGVDAADIAGLDHG
jgi:hypothetical protein